MEELRVSFPAGVYADVRAEHTTGARVQSRDGELVDASVEETLGAFARVHRGGRWVTAATTDLSRLSELLDELARAAAGDSPGSGGAAELPLAAHRGDHRRFAGAGCVAAIPLPDKAALHRAALPMLRRDGVTSWSAAYQDRYVEKRFRSSQGADLRHDAQEAALSFRFVVSDGDRSVRERFVRGAASLDGLHDAGAGLARHLDRCVEYVRRAQPLAAGSYTVVLSRDAAGVFAHEAVGHRSEADFLLGGAALRRGFDLGDRVAGRELSIVDDGSIVGSGYVPWDDEGQPAQRTWLIRDGVLAGRLHSASTAASFGERCTGNARALDFRFEPLVRMTTTWIEPGPLAERDLFAPVDDGVYIETVRHGSGMSTFTMAPSLAWRIERGRVTTPVRVAVASGDVLETLSRIDGVSDQVEIPWLAGGGCGKMEQGPLPVAFGGPLVRIRGLRLA